MAEVLAQLIKTGYRNAEKLYGSASG